MSRKDELFDHVRHEMIIGVVREDRTDDAWEVACAYADNGIRLIEITMTTPDAPKLISRLSRLHGGRGVLVAAGTVRSGEDAATARRCGAQIIVSPHTDVRVVEYAVENDLLPIAGALTPTEIIHAWEAGAGIVKVYPVAHVGGADYIRTIRGPIRDVPMLAGGPVPIDSIESYLDAGVMAVNLGPSIAAPDLVREKKWRDIGRRAAMAVALVQGRRAEINEPNASLVH